MQNFILHGFTNGAPYSSTIVTTSALHKPTNTDECMKNEMYCSKWSSFVPRRYKNCRSAVARLPFSGDTSMQLKKELVEPSYSTNYRHHLEHRKNKQKTLIKYGVVYRLTCSCGSGYIGQTRRNLINRFKEHSHFDKSEVFSILNGQS